MKMFVFVAFLLAGTYATDFDKVKNFYKVYYECTKELEVPNGKINSKALKCVGEKNNMYDEEGKLIKEKAIEYVTKIARAENVEQVLDILHRCSENGYEGPGSNYEKSIMITECLIDQNIMDLFIKLE